MGQDGGGLPSWLVQGKGELEGVPGPEDVRDRLLVRAGDKNRRMISNVANIRVAPLKLKNVQNNVCTKFRTVVQYVELIIGNV